MSDTGNKLRIDKWLWAARFYKTRSLALHAIENGRVLIDGVRVKPAKTIAAGDKIVLHFGQARFDIEVLALSDKRGPAPVAQKLYRESEESIARRALIAEQHRLQPEIASFKYRPTKRDRREIEKFRRGE
ncbi:MAG: RNA-binding S4 domain-containing protein [Gallionella sp.]|nr:RNA-binding S4 domain-containing protein [Gallionella sp.]